MSQQWKQHSIAVAEESQVGEARRAAGRFASDAGMDAVRGGELAIIVTELANNLRKYGREGRLVLRVAPAGNADAAAAVEVFAVDRGAGMSDPGQCLRDGFSTGGTSGTGLGAVRRIAAEFDLYSAAGAGTVVYAKVLAAATFARREAYRPPPRFVWGSMAEAAPGESVSGDAWRVVQLGDVLNVMVADGLGHGELAAEAAEAAARTFEAAFDGGESGGAREVADAPRDLLERMHRHLSGTRGAAVAVASIGPGQAGRSALRYAGIGNISGTLWTVGEGSKGLASHNGTVGVAARRFQEFDYPMPSGSAGAVLLMHSDGLQSRWSLSDHPGLASRHPAVIAAVLMRDHVRGRDDATIVVAKVNA